MTGTGESPERTIHRLESFSDIVIGFCVAEIGLTLALPSATTSSYTIWLNVDLFAVSFVLIAALWWVHHRIFTTYFVLRPLTVALNFTMLGALCLEVYFLQGFVHMIALNAGRIALWFALWAYSFAFVYAMLGAMLLDGLVRRRRTLAAADLRWGIVRLSSIVMAAAFFIFCALTASASHGGVNLGYSALSFVAAIVLINRILLPVWLKRWIREPSP